MASDHHALDGHYIMQILKSLQMNNTIDHEKYLASVKKVKKLQDYLIQTQEAEKSSIQNLTKIKETNNKYNLEFSELQKEQREQQEIINNSTEELRKAKVELTEYENTRIANKIYEIEQKKENIEDLKQKIQNSEDEQMKRLNDEIERYQKACKQKQDLIHDEDNQIKLKTAQIRELQKLKENIEANNLVKLNNIEEQKDDIQRKRNGIQNEKKHIEQNNQALKQLEDEKSDQEKRENEKRKELQEIKIYLNEKKEKYEAAKNKKESLKREYEMKDKEQHNLNRKKKDREKENEDLLSKKVKIKAEKDELVKDLAKAKEFKETLRKLADERKKLTTEKENSKMNAKYELDEEETNLKHIKAKLEKVEKDIGGIEENVRDVNEEINFKERKERNKDQLITIEKSSQKEFNNQAKYLETSKKRLIEKVEQLKSNIEEMKNIRQTMSRAVAAREEKTRAINDEIQIKELIFLDMTKRHEELKNKYQSYHLKYETVLNERNKNVLKIQNANQRKSETKEKMKIIKTEMDIIQSELTETKNQLTEKKKELDKMKQKQDALKKEINEYQFEFKKHEEEIKKLTNENEKLHSILNSIENEMVSKRAEYESACESRNLSGINLIDRNDELCVFYEKIQHLETEINMLYKNILDKEQKIQRLKVDNSEVERFIEVNRRKIPLIPSMSNSIKELDNELKLLNKALEELVSHIESPDNEELKRELPGEDPEIDYLKMKYQQLCEMLNDKKETLLEKELINEEINEIAEKLRKKALDDRAKNLDISEKMNTYEIQFNEITRKNIAITSELSMFKAILFNLEHSKKDKEEQYKKALDEFREGNPPTEDCKHKLDTMMKLEQQRQEFYQKRKDEIREKENRPYIMPLRKGPPKRFNEYEDDQTGLKKCYGQYAPFAVYPTPPNMRHYKSLSKSHRSSNRSFNSIN